jgi:hypothetical protein
MKIFSFFAVFLLLVACSGESSDPTNYSQDIPKAALTKFETTFPKAKDVKWEKEGEYFVAEFTENGLEKEVIYDSEGNLVATETEIKISEIPSKIIDYVNENYIGAEIEEAEKIESVDGNFFEVEIEYNDSEVELLFDESGNFLRREEDEAEIDDDDEDDDEENEKEISISELPQTIKDDVASRYPGAVITEADEVTLNDGTLRYDVEIKLDGREIDLVYDSEGTFLGEEND